MTAKCRSFLLALATTGVLLVKGFCGNQELDFAIILPLAVEGNSRGGMSILTVPGSPLTVESEVTPPPEATKMTVRSGERVVGECTIRWTKNPADKAPRGLLTTSSSVPITIRLAGPSGTPAKFAATGIFDGTEIPFPLQLQPGRRAIEVRLKNE